MAPAITTSNATKLQRVRDDHEARYPGLAVAERALLVVTPAPAGVISLERAHVVIAGGHRRPVGIGADLRRRRRFVRHEIVAELGVVAVTPAPHRAVRANA